MLFLLLCRFALLGFAISQPNCGLDYKWSCGATESQMRLSLSEQMSCAVAVPLCPRTLNAINNCCVRHDACYSQKMGQQFCDDLFCQCLCVSQWDGPLCASQVGAGFCVLVRIFGVFIYNKPQ
ncbi:hypothetical protein niasHS_014943 [Heterodera schachtii]|uniref:Uncharacterized protein n=1 Tax=Heterodera schachtii TaxID=97005 RepID=A0ABD2I404_HETSC